MTEALPEPEPRPGSRPLLGELLVNAGLVTPEVMAQALAEQQRTGLPIGRILVEGGYIPGHRLAMALADQHGGPVRTEYGFATGHAAAIVPAPLQQVASELPSLRVVAPEAGAAPVEATPAAPEPEPEPEPEPQLEPAAVVAQPEPEPQPAAAPVVDEERERLVSELAQAEASLKDLMRLLEQEQAARGEAEEQLTATREEAARERAEREQADARLRDVAQVLAQEKSARADAEAKAAELEAAVEAAAADPRAYPIDRHVLFVPGGEKYRLLERTGPPPATDSRLELDGTAFTVLRLGPAPTPERLACAFLEAVHEEAPA